MYASNITKHSEEADLQNIYDSLWVPSGFTMTKEIWLHRKLWFFAKHFHVVCFGRRTCDSMPPTRARVVSWMHTIANELGVSGGSFVGDAINGYEAWIVDLARNAAELNLPFVWWHDIMTAKQGDVEQTIAGLRMPGVDVAKCAENIVATRMSPEQCNQRRSTPDAHLWRKALWEPEAQHRSQHC